MKIVDSFPHTVRVIENCWIPMSDGCHLAARIWLPADAETTPVPAILEYIPYRKRDFTRARDEPMHHYFAGHGYAAVRVDLRGSGDSDGLLLDEYLQQEHDDALEVIRWIAQQPWCSGAVGMMGKSWGGFNSLQVAARRPPELKAIITVCSTDDRYLDDVHYMGGCLLNENLTWGSVLMSLQRLPAGSRARRRALARHVARASRTCGIFPRGVARTFPARRLLEARLSVRRLRCHHLPRLCHRRLGRCLQQRDSPALGRAQGTAQRPHRTLGPSLSARRGARSSHRIPARGAALVGSLAEGH